MPHEEILCPVARITPDWPYHFFGYYDKSPWDASGRYLLAKRVAFMRRPPTPEDMAVIGLIDLQEDNRWRPLADTTAWYWQQGCMLQWLPSAPDRKIIYNTRTSAGFGSAILDIETGERRDLPRPIYALTPDGRSAVTLNFSRVHRTRPGYGYVGVTDPWEGDLAPKEDGLYCMDLDTGESRLIVSLTQMAAYDPEPTMAGAEHWFNHLQFNTAGTRFLFLHRWKQPGGAWRRTRMFTANPDGSDIVFLGREGMVSHFDWRDESHILAWSTYGGENRYHLYEDRSDRVDIVGEDVFDQDGHCSYSPDRQWVLTDTYPSRDRSERTLIVYHPETNRRIDIGRFYAAPDITGEIRCDLHPRWSRDGRQVCFDSIHEGGRQMYVADVSGIVG